MIRVPLPVILAGVYFICAGICTDMPRFSYNSKDCRLVPWQEEWHAGCPNSIAMLNRYGVQLYIDTEGDIVSQRVSIYVTCPGSSSPTKMRLKKNNTTTRTFCKTEKFPVELRHDSSTHHIYKLSVLKPDAVDLQSAFRKSLNIFIEVEVLTSNNKTMVLKSDLLHVYSIRWIWNWRQDRYDVDILTPEAKDFFKSTPYPSTEDFPQIQFLRKDFVAHLKNAIRGTFFENLLEVGGFMSIGRLTCMSNSADSVSIYNHIADISYDTADEIYYHLNLADGKLRFSRAGISISAKAKANIFKNDERSLCMSISFGVFTLEKKRVRRGLPTSYNINNYKDMTRSYNCIKASSADEEELIVFAGIRRYPLKCPIICDFDVDLEFKHGTKTLLTSSGRNGKRKANHNSIVLPKYFLDASDSGTYSCRYRDSSVDLQHTFNVSVVSLPYFQTKENPKQDGSLPPVIYAVEGESLSYSCTVFYYGLPVALAPEIFHSSVSHGWRGPLSDSDYNNYLSSPGSTESFVKDDSSVGASTLTVKVKKVPSMDRSTMRNFTHRFHCKASVPETDKHLRILNMKDYTVVSGSNVIYIPKPTSSHIIASHHNKCSREGCNSEAGASFSFKFSSNFAAYIRKIGVKVTGYFMLGDLNVASIPVIKPEYSTLNEAKDFELKLTIPAITEDLLSELQKRKTLTAVYNFNYNSNDLHAGLQLEKSKYGKAREADDEDCRSDKLKTCFYSTSFPAYVNDSSLNFLTTYFYVF